MSGTLSTKECGRPGDEADKKSPNEKSRITEIRQRSNKITLERVTMTFLNVMDESKVITLPTYQITTVTPKNA